MRSITKLAQIKSMLRNNIRRTSLHEDSLTKHPNAGASSIDVQVDKYLRSYENEAVNSKNEGLDQWSISKRLLEKDDEEKDDKDVEKDDEESSDDSLEAEKKTIDDIDMLSYCEAVARLVDNFTSLVDYRTAVIRRASELLEKSYDNDVVRRFTITMEDSYDLVAGEQKRDYDDIDVPSSAYAGPIESKRRR